MGTIIDDAFEVDALILTEKVAIFSGDFDPNVIGQIAPVGSLFVKDDGQLFTKRSENDDYDWSGPNSAAVSGVISVTVPYTADNKVVILVDTSLSDVTITLPNAVTFINRLFFIKWIKTTSNYKCNLQTTGNQVIDNVTSLKMKQLFDCLQLVSDGSNWYII